MKAYKGFFGKGFFGFFVVLTCFFTLFLFTTENYSFTNTASAAGRSGKTSPGKGSVGTVTPSTYTGDSIETSTLNLLAQASTLDVLAGASGGEPLQAAAVSPLASFVADPVSNTAGAPVAVQFTDTSTGSPTSWFWDFGDGQTSTDQDPMVAYHLPGTYPVTLTVANDAGSDSLTEDFVVNDCATAYSVMLESNNQFYDSIMTAYGAADVSGDSIMLMAGTISPEDVDLYDDIPIALKGGFDCSFYDNYMYTSLPGSITIAAGSVTVSNLVLSPPPLCEPGDPNNFPGNQEICDGLDNNCNGLIDDGLSFDSDGDGYTSIDSCAGSADDCDDDNPNTFPGHAEICDGQDNNCDGFIDEGLTATDADGDGYTSEDSCGGSADDCDDGNPDIHPGAVEYLGDEIDQNCDGADLFFPSIENYCFGCHYEGDINNWWHTSVEAPDGTCAGCHAPQVNKVLQGHYGMTVKTAGNNMTAGSIIGCTSCHDQNHETYSGGANIVWPKVVATWDDQAGTYVNLTCDTCHEDRAAAHDTETAHDHRLILTLCGNCHTSDTSVLGQPGTGTLASAADVDALHRSDCNLCHGYAGTKLDPVLVAQVIQDGMNGTNVSCLTCHTNFEAVHAFLENHNNLVNVGTTSCGNCHYDPPPLVDPLDPKVHSFCANCHDENYNTISLAAGHTFDEDGDCTICHTDPFDTVHPATVDHSDIVTTTGTQCGTCHTSTLLVDPADPKVHDACGTCHDFYGGLIGLASGQSAPGNCNNCHGADFTTVHPETVDHTALVTVGTTSCGNCHYDQPLVDDTDPKVHNDCTTCHDTDGVLKSLAAGHTFDEDGDCTTCHTDPFDTVHPSTVDHSEIVTTTGTQCGNCHTSTLLVDPANPKVHNSCGSCHDVYGGLISLASGQSAPGNCNNCHGADFTTIHPETVDHSALVTVGTTSCGNCHYDQPLVDDTDPKVHNDCTTCHDTDGVLKSLAAGHTFDEDGDCTTCHTDPFDTIHPSTVDHSDIVTTTGTQCGTCHTRTLLVDPADPKVHNSCGSCHDVYGGLISLASGQSAPGNCNNCHGADFTAIHPETVNHSQAIQLSTDCALCHTSPLLVDPADPTVHNSCGSCHDTNGALISLASGNPAPNECITCHGSNVSDIHASHVATPGSDYVLVFESGQHDSAMVGDGEIYIACLNCHNNQLGLVHDNNCSTCHPSPYDTLGTWAGGCQQGGCHTTYHADVTDAHNSVVDYETESNCTLCHVNPDWGVTADACANCHAATPYGTTAPVTTSDAQSYYIVPAIINFSITKGGKVGLGTTYSRIDGGALHIGSSIYLTTPGVQTLEFWSVDQAGISESQHNFVEIELEQDTIPPVTMSNAQPEYWSPATITLTATDNSFLGVKTTYYSLNEGPTQTGTTVYVPQLPGSFDYTLQFWSDDWSGNTEDPPNEESFTVIGGTGTFRLVWGDSDTGDPPCTADPEAEAQWTIRNGTTVVASGSGACPGWDGVDDVVVPVSPTPYEVSIDWWNSFGGYWDNTTYTDIYVLTNGYFEIFYY